MTTTYALIARTMACAATLAAALATPLSAGAAAPAPCAGAAQITDVSGDGHHPSTDVLSAWFSEASGHLQAVIKVRAGTWTPEHDDADVNGSGFALLFTTGGQTRFVRATAPPADQGPITYDYGTYTPGGGFAAVGATTGAVVYEVGGTVTIDVPAAIGVTAGTVLTNPFVLTYDGITAGFPAWVDHAPGGVLPTDPAFGADYVVGSCTSATAPGGATSGGVPGIGTSTGAAPGAGAGTGLGGTTAVQLRAPARLVGGGTVLVTGRVVPARAGVAVALSRRGRSATTSRLSTAADGTFRVRVPVRETTRLRAVADGIRSQELSVVVQSTVRIKVRRLRSGAAEVTGVVRPALRGRVLWLRTTAVTPSASLRVSGSTFRFRLRNPSRGRFQAVYIPSGARAERSTSNTGVIR